MAQIELIMPKMGESITEATILKWLKNEGETIQLDEAVLEIATDKVDSEVPTPTAGVLSKLLYKVGDVVPVGKAIAIIETMVDATHIKASQRVNVVTETAVVPAFVENIVAITETPTPKSSVAAGRFYSPLVLNIAREEGISLEQLECLPGTGQEGRVTKKDILLYVEANKSGATQLQSTAAVPTNEIIASAHKDIAPQETVGAAQVEALIAPLANNNKQSGNIEIIEMDRMRRLIADHMVMSKHVSPHVTSFVECDVTNLSIWRDKAKKIFEKREDQKLTFTPIFIEAVVKALKEFPKINSSVDGYNIIIKKDINIGMAAALPNGNLIVPVIKNAANKNLVGLTKDVNDLANRARANQLKPDDTTGGTFTITNVGTFGNLMGTPIINQPQVAILATGAIKKKPVVLETPQGDVIAIRQMMFLSLSYDHRVVDGAMGGAFLRRIADILEQFDCNRDI